MEETGIETLQESDDAKIERFLAGEALYGDDFSPEQIKEWFDDEREGYAGLGAGDASTYAYQYHALNVGMVIDTCRKVRSVSQWASGRAMGKSSARSPIG